METKSYYTSVKEAVQKIRVQTPICKNDRDCAEVRERFDALEPSAKEFSIRTAEGGETVSARFIMLEAHDAERAIALNDLVARGVNNPKVFNSDQEIERNLNGEGWGFGVTVQDSLVAMVIISTIPADWEKLVKDSPLADIPACQGAIRDIVVVRRDFRGNGLQRRLIELAAHCLPKEREHLISTISPNNPASLISALSAGCHIVHWGHFYGGRERFLTYMHVRENSPDHVHQLPMLVPLSNTRVNRAMLTQGYRAIGMEKSEHGLALRYGMRRIAKAQHAHK
ncbi:MAG: hypothetical protein SOZ52_02675 [Pyramidobacter sp.]|nr:hypothetical protein [Pyramidobacter sp.]